MSAQAQPLIDARGFPGRDPALDGATTAVPGTWMRVEGEVYVGVYVKASGFTGTLTLEASYDAINVAQAAVLTFNANTVSSATVFGPFPAPFARINPTVVSGGTIDAAYVYGFGGK